MKPALRDPSLRVLSPQLDSQRVRVYPIAMDAEAKTKTESLLLALEGAARSHGHLFIRSIQYVCAGVLALSMVADSRAQVLPKPDATFQGIVDISPDNSTPDWPEPITAPDGAPNIVVILLDDVGFAATSTFGGATPTPDVVHGVEQTPLEGTSFLYTFDDAEDANCDRVQYFEIFGSRGIYEDGWWAGSPTGSPWKQGPGTPPVPPDQRTWELYNLERDFSQAVDLSGQMPQKRLGVQQISPEAEYISKSAPIDSPRFAR